MKIIAKALFKINNILNLICADKREINKIQYPERLKEKYHNTRILSYHRTFIPKAQMKTTNLAGLLTCPDMEPSHFLIKKQWRRSITINRTLQLRVQFRIFT